MATRKTGAGLKAKDKSCCNWKNKKHFKTRCVTPVRRIIFCIGVSPPLPLPSKTPPPLKFANCSSPPTPFREFPHYILVFRDPS